MQLRLIDGRVTRPQALMSRMRPSISSTSTWVRRLLLPSSSEGSGGKKPTLHVDQTRVQANAKALFVFLQVRLLFSCSSQDDHRLAPAYEASSGLSGLSTSSSAYAQLLLESGLSLANFSRLCRTCAAGPVQQDLCSRKSTSARLCVVALSNRITCQKMKWHALRRASLDLRAFTA